MHSTSGNPGAPPARRTIACGMYSLSTTSLRFANSCSWRSRRTARAASRARPAPARPAKLEAIGCPYLSKPFPINVLVAETNTLLGDAVERRAELALLLPRLVAKTAPLRIAGERVRETARRKRVSRSPRADAGG